jgi:hypothetical protein
VRAEECLSARQKKQSKARLKKAWLLLLICDSYNGVPEFEMAYKCSVRPAPRATLPPPLPRGAYPSTAAIAGSEMRIPPTLHIQYSTKLFIILQWPGGQETNKFM